MNRVTSCQCHYVSVNPCCDLLNSNADSLRNLVEKFKRTDNVYDIKNKKEIHDVKDAATILVPGSAKTNPK